MQARLDRNLLYHELRQMMDLFCSPDLTVAEAKVLRPRLDDLLAKIDDHGKDEEVAALLRGRSTVCT